MMEGLPRRLARLLPVLVAAAACGGDDTAGDAGLDAPADTVGADAPTDVAPDVGPDVPADDAAGPEDGPGAENAPDGDGPDEAHVGEAGETTIDAGPDVGPDDAEVEVCEPSSVGWGVPLVLSPAELQALLEAGDRILINVFDGDIPEIPGTDAQLPWTDVPAIEAYLAHDLCADLVLYCRRGVRSGEVAAVLVEHGYRFVRVLDGGIEAWQAAGYPVE